MSAARTFAASVTYDGVTLVEYAVEHMGLRVVDERSDMTRSTSIDESLDRLSALIAAAGAGRSRVAVTIDQFGVFHQLLTLPPANDAVLGAIVRREAQRVSGLPDPIFAYARGTVQAPHDPARTDEVATAPQVFIAGAPREMIATVAARLPSKRVRVDAVTVAPKAMDALYEASGGSLEPTAVLLCLANGPHVAFFLGGQLQLAIDPPFALDGDRPTVPMVLDQVERASVYFRQQFRGASATRILLAARPEEYAALSNALESRLRVRVKSLFSGVSSAEAVLAMGAALEARRERPLDLFLHPPTPIERAKTLVRGPNRFVAGAIAASVFAMVWSGLQVSGLTSARYEDERLRNEIRVATPPLEPMQRIAERRADVVKQTEFIRAGRDERSIVTSTLAAIASTTTEAVRFDSLLVSRSASGWNGAIIGQVFAATSAAAVRGLDDVYSSVRARNTVSNVTLEQFDYPAASGADSTRRRSGVTISFRIAFELARSASPSPGAR